MSSSCLSSSSSSSHQQQQQQQQQHQQQLEQAKLHPIYTALESRNYSRAIKLSQQKPVSSWPLTKALRAHALERCGRHEEAIQTLEELLGFPLKQQRQQQGRDNNNEQEEEDVLLNELETSLFQFQLPSSSSSSSSSSDNAQTPQQQSSSSSWNLVNDITLVTIAVTLQAYKLYGALITMYSNAVQACERRRKQQQEQVSSSSAAAFSMEDFHNAIKGLFLSYLRLVMQLPAPAPDPAPTDVDSDSDWMALKGTIQHSFHNLGQTTTTTTTDDHAPGTAVTIDNTAPNTNTNNIMMNNNNLITITNCYEAMQSAALQLARNFSHNNNTDNNNSNNNCTIYWSWAVFSILLHYEALLAQQRRMACSSSDANRSEEYMTKLQQKLTMLPRLAETLCKTKIVGDGSKNYFSCSGEDW